MNEKNDLNEDFSINTPKRESNLKSEDNDTQKNYCCFYFLISIMILLIIIIFIALYFYLSLKGKSKKEKDSEILDVNGYINCTYDINDEISENISIINDKFDSKINIIMEINNTEYPFSKSFKFDSLGLTNITFIFNESINMDYMFYNISNLISVEMKTKGNIEIKTITEAFEYCSNLKNISIDGFIGNNIKNMHKLFYKDISLENANITIINTTNLIDCSYMFSNTYLDSLNININTSNVKNMSHMFDNGGMIKYLDLSNLTTKNVVDMSFMFNDLNELEYLNVSNFETNKVINMINMFSNCKLLSNLSLTNFNLEKVKDMSFMFENCASLQNITFNNNFKANEVENISHMFKNCENL